jgi:hypothetical protein
MAGAEVDAEWPPTRHPRLPARRCGRPAASRSPGHPRHRCGDDLGERSARADSPKPKTVWKAKCLPPNAAHHPSPDEEGDLTLTRPPFAPRPRFFRR